MIPHLMNCSHLPDGWCLDCMETMISRAEVTGLLDALRDKVQVALTENDLSAYALRQEIIGEIDTIITALDLGAKEKE